jgi:hypothetical protein
VNTLLHLLAAYGLAFYLQQKAAWLTDPIRTRVELADKLLSCTFCLGFWCGLLVRGAGSVVAGEVYQVGLPEYAFSLLGFGFASAAFSYGVDAAIQWLEENRPPG